jgi:hypothetical protein
MIVTRKKNIELIMEELGDARDIVIVGCSGCAATCRTGGSEQVKEMADRLSERNVIATISIESPCDMRISARDLRRIDKEIALSGAILALACGSGVQSISAVLKRPIVACLDTCFACMVERLGVFHEKCSHCGSCILNDTAGICPATACPKGVRNGPCEGIIGTKCEVDEDRNCVWYDIYEALKAWGRLDRFGRHHGPVDWSMFHTPQKETWEGR